MSKPLTEGSGRCEYAGIPCSFIRFGTKRRLSKRERKWEREKTNRRRRHRWSRWPKMKWAPEAVYFLNEEYLKMAYSEPFKWMDESK